MAGIGIVELAILGGLGIVVIMLALIVVLGIARAGRPR